MGYACRITKALILFSTFCLSMARTVTQMCLTVTSQYIPVLLRYLPFLQENIGIAHDTRPHQFFSKSSFNNHRNIQRQIVCTISAQSHTRPFRFSSNTASSSTPKSSKLSFPFTLTSSMHATRSVHLVFRGRD